MSTPDRTTTLPDVAAVAKPRGELWHPSPLTTAGRVRAIEALGQRVHEYVQFMCHIDTLGGTSAEAKDRAVAAFYDRLADLERQLGRIHEALRLG